MKQQITPSVRLYSRETLCGTHVTPIPLLKSDPSHASHPCKRSSWSDVEIPLIHKIYLITPIYEIKEKPNLTF